MNFLWSFRGSGGLERSCLFTSRMNMLSITALLRFQDIAVSAASASNKLGTQNYNVTIVIFAEIFASEKVWEKLGRVQVTFWTFPLFLILLLSERTDMYILAQKGTTWHHEMNFSWRRFKRPSILEFRQLRPLAWLKILLVKGKTSTVLHSW